MTAPVVILLVSLGYLALLFGVAFYGDRRADMGRSLIANPYVYTLSIAVYCTAWTFYGSVGRAATTGVSFLAVYLGPTLTALLWWQMLRKIVRISKVNRITSIPDFIASRYGKSTLLAGLVTIIAVVGIMPYVALQLKAVSVSFDVLSDFPELGSRTRGYGGDTALFVAILLAAFAILFGTRHIDATERHEGMVLAVAFESLTKLLAFLAVGIFVTFGVFSGFGDVFARAVDAGLADLLSLASLPGGYTSWLTILFLSMSAILFLPRQFQLLVVENVNEDHLRTAAWLFPLYLLVINLFVLPIALAGLLQFPAGAVEADTFVLSLPISEQAWGLALLVFIGGLSAATGMVIVASIALSTMICNDLVMPVLLRIRRLRLAEREDLTRLLVYIRRGGIVTVVTLGYLYYRLIGESYALVSIGLVSFAAAAQFAPAILIGIYWKRANRLGALLGLCGGFLMWFYTLLLPSFALSGWVDTSLIDGGPFGIAFLRPYNLFGLEGLDHLSHAVFWSMLVNVGGLVLGSLFGERSALERVQAELFVDVYRRGIAGGDSHIWRGTARIEELRALVVRFIGQSEGAEFHRRYSAGRSDQSEYADSAVVQEAERLLAGAIGAASARVMVGSVVKGETLGLDEVMTILDETSHIIDYSHRLEEKSRQLQRATRELQAANQRLQELDRLKDEFVSTVTHELRTPLTSIRAFSEILLSDPELEVEQRSEFLGIIVKETERLTRLINDVLDFAKIESGRIDWHMEELRPQALIEDAVRATGQLFKDRSAVLDVQCPSHCQSIIGDYDRLMQVLINLLSNAVKFCAEVEGHVEVALEESEHGVLISVADNGPGVPAAEREAIFDQFHQVQEKDWGKPQGTGLGLAISLRIVEHHNGRIWVESAEQGGARFWLALPSAMPSEESST